MVKNKNYNHPEVAVLREGDLQRIKVSLNNNIGNHPQTYQVRTGARTQTSRRRERVQIIFGKSEERRNVEIRIREKEEVAIGRIRTRTTSEEWSHQPTSSRSSSLAVG
jgi:hypothetical protein